MKVLVLTAILSSMFIIPGSALADSAANVGEPFGREVVSPAARDKEIKAAVHENVPGGLDDVIHENLADDGEAGDIRGNGKNDAPGRNK